MHSFQKPEDAIKSIREKLVAFLGQYHPVFSEKHNSYFHKNARLTLLEQMTGCFALSAEDKECMSINLLMLMENPSQITIANLNYLIKKMDAVLELTYGESLRLSLDKNIKKTAELTSEADLNRILRISPHTKKQIVETKNELKALLQRFILQTHKLNLMYGSNNRQYDKRFVGALNTIIEDQVATFKKYY